MKRSILAFLVAPLWVPVWAGVFGQFAFKPEPGIFGPGQEPDWFLASLVAGLAIGYGATWFLGIPAHLTLGMRRWTAWSVYLSVGAGLGILTRLLGRLAYGLSRGDPAHAATYAVAMFADPAVILAPMILGMLVALTVWAIARPDLSGRMGV